MRRTQASGGKRRKERDLMATDEPGWSMFQRKQGDEKDLLLRHPNFVAKSKNRSFETPPLACEASALTTELTALERSYFSGEGSICKTAGPAEAVEEVSFAVSYDLCSLSCCVPGIRKSGLCLRKIVFADKALVGS